VVTLPNWPLQQHLADTDSRSKDNCSNCQNLDNNRDKHCNLMDLRSLLLNIST